MPGRFLVRFGVYFVTTFSLWRLCTLGCMFRSPRSHAGVRAQQYRLQANLTLWHLNESGRHRVTSLENGVSIHEG